MLLVGPEMPAFLLATGLTKRFCL